MSENALPLSFPTELSNEPITSSKLIKNGSAEENAPPAVETRTSTRCVLEDFTVCSKSHLWKLMMSFYDRKGPESWSQGIVPHFITCNTFISKSYVKVLHGFLADCMRPNAAMPVDPSEPLYIIELGAGSGKFTYFMLKCLEEMAEVCDFPLGKIKFIMTDFTEANFTYWQSHSALKKYFENGSLDAGIFDAVNDKEIKLWKAGTVLTTNSCKNPIIIIANYLFDTLYHDIFQVEMGQLKEGLVSTGSKFSEEIDPLHPDIIQRLENAYLYRAIDANTYYPQEEGDEQHIAEILTWYQEYFSQQNQNASILLPIGALRALRRLATFSQGRALVISGDKGNNNPEQFTGLMDPHIAVHGSFSLMVNYHAIGAWFTSRGGFALHNPQEEASLKVSTFALCPEKTLLHNNKHSNGSSSNSGSDCSDSMNQSILGPKLVVTNPLTNPLTNPDNTNRNNANNNNTNNNTDTTNKPIISPSPSQYNTNHLTTLDEHRMKSFPYLKQSFLDFVEGFGPNDFFVLQKSLKEDVNNPPLRTVVALLKLGDWDPDVFYKFRDVILQSAPTCASKLKNDLCRGIPKVWSNYYLLDSEKDIAFEIGRFYYGIREYEKALFYYEESQRTIGEHHVTFHNQGLCHYSLGHFTRALELFHLSYNMNHEYEKAKSWIEKVTNEMKHRERYLLQPSQPTKSTDDHDSYRSED